MLVVHVSRNGMLPIAWPTCLCSNTVFFFLFDMPLVEQSKSSLFTE